MNIHLHIDRLILENLPTGDTQAGQIRAAVEKELARLLATGGLRPELRQASAFARVPVSEFQMKREMRAPVLARGIAHAIHDSIGAPASGRPKR